MPECGTLRKPDAGRGGVRYLRQYEIMPPDGSRELARLSHSKRADFVR